MFSFLWKIIDIFIWITDKITLQIFFWIHVSFKNAWWQLHKSIYFTESTNCFWKTESKGPAALEHRCHLVWFSYLMTFRHCDSSVQILSRPVQLKTPFSLFPLREVNEDRYYNMAKTINLNNPSNHLSFDYSCRIEKDVQEMSVYSRTLMHCSITLSSSEETWPQSLQMALTCPESWLMEI